MARPLVSVIIPTFNRIDLFKKAVTSVLKQTFTDYELIISDDLSRDGTRKWALNLSKNNSKVRYFRNRKNLGMIANWNAGLGHTRGKYISILMDDDLWHSKFLQETVNILEQRHNVGLTCVNAVPFYSKEINKEDKYPKDAYRLYKHNMEVKGLDCIRQYLETRWLVGLPSAILVRKECFNKLGKFNKVGLDPEMWLRICSKYDFYYLDKRLSFWRIHGESFTRKEKLVYSIRRRFYLVNKIFSYSRLKSEPSILLLKKPVYKNLRKEVMGGWLSGRQLSIYDAFNIYKTYLSTPIYFKDILAFFPEFEINNLIKLYHKLKKAI